MRRVILLLAVVAGASAAVGGPLLAVALVALWWLGRGRDGATYALPIVSVPLALACLGLALGVALAWAGWSALRGRPGHPFRLPRWGWWALALAATVAGGQAAMTAGVKAPVPLLHLAAAALPPFLFLALALGPARRAGSAVTTRPAVGSIAWGGLGGAGLAMMLEGFIVMAFATAAALWLAASHPEWLAELQAWAREVQETGSLGDLTALMPLVASPVLVVGILGLLGLVLPLIEEVAKSLAVPLVALTGRRLTRTDGFLLGAASGAGFALLEGIFNGSLALVVPSGAWAGLMLARASTAAVHCCAAGLAGLGWQAILVERRRARAAGFWALATALHGGWNLISGVQSWLGLRRALQAGGEPLGGGAPQSLPFVLLLGGLWVVALLVLALLPGRLARAE